MRRNQLGSFSHWQIECCAAHHFYLQVQTETTGSTHAHRGFTQHRYSQQPKNRSETMQLECSTSTQWLLSEHKRNEIHIIIQMNCEWHYTKVKRPDTKDHILFDCFHEVSTREKCKRQKVNGCLLVAGNRQTEGAGFLFRGDENILQLGSGNGYTVPEIKTTKSYTLKWWTLPHMDCLIYKKS